LGGRNKTTIFVILLRLRMERYLIIKTRDELLRIKIGQILYFEADRNYTKLLLSNGIQFTFAINIGKIEEILEKQVAGSSNILMRVGKSHIINKDHILQINLPKQRLLLLTGEGKPKELVISKDPLKTLKDSFEKEMGKAEEERRKKEEEEKDTELP
jgi:DNA-binding LytR/AlgR family response regulator